MRARADAPPHVRSNLVVTGGDAVCEAMVADDVITSLVSAIAKVCARVCVSVI